MRLEWSLYALEDRNRIFDHIRQDNPRAAVTVDDRIREMIEHLKKFPELGHDGRIEGTRELVIPRTPYIAAYRITGDMVRILRVLHGAQLWPDAMPDGEL